MFLNKQKIAILGLYLVIIVIFTACTDITSPSKPPIFPDGHIFQVENSSDWEDAIIGINRSGNEKSYTIYISSDFSIPGKSGWSSYTFNDLQDIKINIIAETEKTITLTKAGCLLSINENQDVYMENINVCSDVNTNGHYSIYVKGSLEMKNGSLSSTTNYIVGFLGAGGVRVINGNFLMSGNATMIGNDFGIFTSGNATIQIRDNASISGGTWGIYMEDSTTLDMYNNASIFNNSRGLSADLNSQVTMYDNSSFYENIVQGVYIGRNSSFIMKDESSVLRNTGWWGGGVHLGSGSNFTMQDNAIISNNSGTAAGGIFIERGCNFTMKDNATISGNYAEWGGGGIRAENISQGDTHIRILGGVIYGNDEGHLSNTSANSGAALFRRMTATITYGPLGIEHQLLPHTDGHDDFSDNTIRVINGVLFE